MINVDCIICGDYILPIDEGLSVIRNGAVVIKGTEILEVGTSDNILKKYVSDTIIKGENKVVLPGFVNTHTHAAMVYFRGIADDLPLTEWLKNYIWPAENKWLSPQFISDAIELACLEMLKGGVTTYNDMYFFEDAAGESSKKTGMRAVLGCGILDFPTVSAKTTDEYLENAERFVSNWKGDELITPCIAPHAIYTCSSETLKKSKSVAQRLGVPLHIHLSETEWEVGEIKLKHKKRPVEYLESLGFLDKNVLAAHCIWVEDNEIEILAKRLVFLTAWKAILSSHQVLLLLLQCFILASKLLSVLTVRQVTMTLTSLVKCRQLPKSTKPYQIILPYWMQRQLFLWQQDGVRKHWGLGKKLEVLKKVSWLILSQLI
jgi:5-methylthioadenosine/S-adenosylhomocysteine deaminase